MEIFTTVNFNIIYEICSIAQKKRKMYAIIGYTGAGKTVGLKYYKNKFKNVIYITVRKSMTSKEFYISLLRSIGYEGDAINLSLYVIINLIIEKINLAKENCLLIIDEAGKFKPSQLEYVHELRDQTQDKMGIILSGPEYFYDNLLKWKASKVVGIPEVFRRIQMFENLPSISFTEAKNICLKKGVNDIKIIRKIFKRTDNYSELMNNIENYQMINLD